MNLDDLVALCEAAAPGPWAVRMRQCSIGPGYNNHAEFIMDSKGDEIASFTSFATELTRYANAETERELSRSPRNKFRTGEPYPFSANAALIAAAREHFPACLRRVKELTAALAEAEAIIEAASAVDVIHFDGEETGHSQITVDRAASEQRLHDLLAARREKGGAK